MNADEILDGLKCLLERRSVVHAIKYKRFSAGDLIGQAAELIESLTAQLKQRDETQFTHCCHNCESLAKQLAESQCREQAAVEDIEELMSGIGLKHYETCAYCQMQDDENCFDGNGKCKAKWRGPQEAGEGEAE